MQSASRSLRPFLFRNLGLAALLLAVTVAVYLPALTGEFLLDDDLHVTRPELRSWHGLERIWFEVGATQQYYPVLHSAFWVEHRLWGDAVLGYHLTNVLLHTVAAGLVVAIMRRLRLPGAWLGGFIFAVHPVGVESVAWIAEQKNTLSAVFYLTSALAYLRFDQQRGRSWYLLASGLFVLALLGKTSTATLPAVLLVIFWWQRSRLEWKRDVLPLLPWFGAAAIAGFITVGVERKLILGINAVFSLTWLDRCLLAGRVLWFYVLKLLWPVNLAFIYPKWPVNSAVWWQVLFPLAVLALAAGLVLVARRARGPLAAFLFFGGTLFPVLGFVNVEWFVFSFVADHLQYLASLGIIVPLAVGLTCLVRKMPGALPQIAPGLARKFHPLSGFFGRLTAGGRRVIVSVQDMRARKQNRQPVRQAQGPEPVEGAVFNLARMPISLQQPKREDQIVRNLFLSSARMPWRVQRRVRSSDSLWLRLQAGCEISGLGVTLVAALGALTWHQSSVYRDNVSLYRHAVAHNPGSPVAHNHLGAALARIPGRRLEAIAQFEAALQLNPSAAEVHENLGGVLLAIPERLPEAIHHLEVALQIKPGLTTVHATLGRALSNVPSRLPDAIAHFRAALRREPENPFLHAHLGNALTQTPGGLPEAVAEYEVALRLKPDFAGAHFDRGKALAGTADRAAEAIAEYETALRLDPNFAEAYYNLGNALLKFPSRRPEAISHFEAALRVKPDFAEAHTNLGTALAGTPGRLPEAIAHFEAALRINPDFTPARNNLRNARQLLEEMEGTKHAEPKRQ